MRMLSLGLSFAIASSGCSMLTARGPGKATAHGDAPRCNASKGTVTLDGTVAILLGFSALLVGVGDAGSGVVVGLVSGAYAAAAGYGNHTANACRKATSDHERATHEPPQDRGSEAAETVASTPSTPAPVVSTAPPRPPPPPATPEPDPEAVEAAEDAWHDFWVEGGP